MSLLKTLPEEIRILGIIFVSLFDWSDDTIIISRKTDKIIKRIKKGG